MLFVPFVGKRFTFEVLPLSVLIFVVQRRVEGVDHLSGDGMLRLGCFLSWALFRRRIVLDDHPVLAEFQRRFEADPAIAATHPEKLA